MTSTLAAQLQSWIECWSAELRRSSALLQLAKRGELPPHALALYLESLRYLFRASPEHLGLAEQAARCVGRPDLAAYFSAKELEEHGHDAWASSDLARLPPAAASGTGPARAIEALVELQRSVIAMHPMCFLAYIAWAEYFTVLLGDEWLDALSASGYARTQISSIARHVDADREHAPHSFAEIERLWHGDPEPEVMLRTVADAGRLFAAFCDEVFDAAAQDAPGAAGPTRFGKSDQCPV